MSSAKHPCSDGAGPPPWRRTPRVLIAKPGLDGHDRGAKIVAQALRNAGMEVIYGGLHLTPGQIVRIAVQEDVDVIGLSVLSGAHLTLFRKTLALMKENGLDDVLLFGGGTIPGKDCALLKSWGVAALFTPGTDTREIVDYLRQNLEILTHG